MITLQETKLGQKTDFKIDNYQVFQRNRNRSGGGILTAVDPSLGPTLISCGSEAEVLTVQVEVNQRHIRIINGYGPQSDEGQQKRLEFWYALDQEIVDAKRDGCMILIQMDANAKVGQSIIAGDPNQETDSNGHELLGLVERNGLVILNADDRCSGTVTRQRVTKKSEERAVLDYILVCHDLYLTFNSMEIDEDRLFPFTNYSSKGKNKPSDHNVLIASFDLLYSKKRFSIPRREVFNFKNIECQKKFHLLTNDCQLLKELMEDNGCIEM